MTLVLLGSYACVSQLGEYDVDEHGSGIDYIRRVRFAPSQTEELLERIAELHRTHRSLAHRLHTHWSSCAVNSSDLFIPGIFGVNPLPQTNNFPPQNGFQTVSLNLSGRSNELQIYDGKFLLMDNKCRKFNCL